MQLVATGVLFFFAVWCVHLVATVVLLLLSSLLSAASSDSCTVVVKLFGVCNY